MEWWRLFSGTFLLIFLAELGDKTQLAAMARATGGPAGGMARWVVFLAASSALALSTFIAVFLGDALKRAVPEPYIKTASGALFVAFGAAILFGVWQSRRAGDAPAAEGAAESGPGYLGQLAIRAAIDFESAGVARYRRYAAAAGNPDVAALLRQLADEEDGHLSRLNAMARRGDYPAFPDGFGCPGPRDAGLDPEPAGTGKTRAILARLLEYEKASGDFYQSLADKTAISSLRSVFQLLANEERGHASRLERRFSRRNL